METDVPSAIAGATLGLPFAGIGGPVGAGLALGTSVAGTKIAKAVNPSLKSAGPSETMEIIADWEEQGVSIIYSATKYSEGGMDIRTSISADGVIDSATSEDYYPYNAFKEE
jgi:hypothetical protein